MLRLFFFVKIGPVGLQRKENFIIKDEEKIFSQLRPAFAWLCLRHGLSLNEAKFERAYIEAVNSTKNLVDIISHIGDALGIEWVMQEEYPGFISSQDSCLVFINGSSDLFGIRTQPPDFVEKTSWSQGWVSHAEIIRKDLLISNEKILFLFPKFQQASMESLSNDSLENVSSWDLLKHFLKPEREDIQAIVIYSIIIGCLSLVMPIGVQSLVNTVAFGAMLQPVVVLTGLVSMGLIFSGVLRVIQFIMVETLQRKLFYNTAKTLVSRLLNKVLLSPLQDDLSARITRFYDISVIQKNIAGLLLEGLSIVLQMVIGFVLLAIYHPMLLFLDVIIIGAIVMIVMNSAKKAFITSFKESSKKHELVDFLQDVSKNQFLFYGKKAKRWVESKVNSILTEHLLYRQKHFKILFKKAISSVFVQVLANVLLLGVGGALVIKKQLTLGQLVAAEIVVNSLVGGISKFYKHLESFYDLIAGLKKLFWTINFPVGQPVGSWVDSSSTNSLGVLSGYSSDNWFFIKGAATQPLERGELQIVFPDKIQDEKKILLEFLPSTSGGSGKKLQFLDLNLEQWNKSHLMEQMAILADVPQFKGRIIDYLSFDSDLIQLADMQRLCNFMGISHLYNGEEGLFKEISHGEFAISLNERVRLILARQLIEKKQLLIMKDPFLSLVLATAQDALLKLLHSGQTAVVLLASFGCTNINDELKEKAVSLVCYRSYKEGVV